MLGLSDKRWKNLKGGYRVPFDPRPFLEKLEKRTDTEAAWHELWEGLHHQGDVGEASYAAVPHLVRIYRQRKKIDWNIYAIVAIIDLARDEKRNPTVPPWLRKSYFGAIQELAEIARSKILQARDSEDIRSVLSVIAIATGIRVHARFLAIYSGEELLDLEKLALEAEP